MSESVENKENTNTQEEKKVEPSENPKTSLSQQRKSSSANYDISYEEAIFQRKQESFTSFDGWETKRKELIDKHRTIANNLITRIEKKLEWIDMCIEQIVKFFKERVAQEESYINVTTQGLPQLGKIFTNTQNPDIFRNFAKAMTEVDEYHKKTCQNSIAMVKFLKSGILESIILVSEKEYRKKLDGLREPVVESKKNLTAITLKVTKKTDSYRK
jgi:hypothetical protein